jgi:hypothetical protein
MDLTSVHKGCQKRKLKRRVGRGIKMSNDNLSIDLNSKKKIK